MSGGVSGTTPYPWPYDGDLGGARTALVVVVPAGTGMVDGDLLAAVADLAGAVREVRGLVVLAVTAAPGRPSSTRLAPAAEVEPSGAVAPTGARVPAVVPDELVRATGATRTVHAGGLDAFYGSDLDLVLRSRGIERLLLAGVGLETAVHSTMRDANDRGYECLLVVDACAPVDAGLVPAAVSMIEMSGGIFGAVGRSADVVAALSPAALRPEGALT